MAKFNYERKYNELQKILEEIEDEKLPIDQLAEKVKKAKKIVEECKAKLRDIEEDLSMIDEE